MNRIIDRIYVGDWNDALSLKYSNPNCISAVLNVCENIDYEALHSGVGVAPGVAYLHEPFPDHLPIPESKFNMCMNWLGAQYSVGRIILIHCALGVSRSPTICAAFLTKLGISKNIDEGLQIIKIARPEVNPSLLTFASAKEYLT
jgi:protein-tyrosine phosphatase